MREEVEAVLADEGGWSKVALQKMRKVDSFLKECQRFEGLGARTSHTSPPRHSAELMHAQCS